MEAVQLVLNGSISPLSGRVPRQRDGAFSPGEREPTRISHDNGNTWYGGSLVTIVFAFRTSEPTDLADR